MTPDVNRISRRALVSRGGRIATLVATADASAIQHLLAGPARHHPRARSAAGAKIQLAAFGAKGDGRTDDTAAIQAAVNATPEFGTVSGRSGAIYVVNGTIGFPRDNVMFDLGGASIRTGMVRQPGSPAAMTDALFQIKARTAVRITNGSILASLAPFTGTFGAKILISDGNQCVVDRLNADASGSAFVYLAGNAHRVTGNTVKNGGIGGFSCSNVEVSRNVLANSPANAILFVGSPGGKVVGLNCLANVIRGHGRIGIETGGTTVAPNISFNRIEAPSRANRNGVAISVPTGGAMIKGNDIIDARGYGIEVAGLENTVDANLLRWTRPSVGTNAAIGIVVNSSTRDTPFSAVIENNHIINANIGITVFAQQYLAPFKVRGNTITDPVTVGIGLTPPKGRPATALCHNNTIHFTVPPRGKTSRIGITTASGATVRSNTIKYDAKSTSDRAYDLPVLFVGNAVTLVNNTTNGGGRADKHIGSSSLGGKWRGWKLTGNHFVNGAEASSTGLIAPHISGNVGLVA